MLVKSLAVVFCLQILLPSALFGNDGAAEIALGGIRLKQERRVSMVKERLFISKKKVRVEYEFFNESKVKVTTEIAFPIPDYTFNLGIGWEPFDDFKVVVNGVDLRYQTEATAWVDGENVTPLLGKLGIQITSFGDWKEGRYSRKEGNSTPSTSQMHNLSDDQLKLLVAKGIIEDANRNDPWGVTPNWTVKKTYHWTQNFPAGNVVHIQHEYTPSNGSSNYMSIDNLTHPILEEGNLNQGAEPGCSDEPLRQAIKQAVEKRNRIDPKAAEWRRESVSGEWVRYILTTANTWKTPIRDFELVVERDSGELVTFCWDGPVEKSGANTFRARVKDFVPKKELTVYFLQP